MSDGTCPKCGQPKPPAKHKRSWCLRCHNEANKRYNKSYYQKPEAAQKHRERQREYSKGAQWRARKLANWNRHDRWRFPEKVRARQAVKRAIETGRLVRPAKCQKCGEAKPRIEAHHHDYSRPLDVTWLCPLCHSAADKIVRGAAWDSAGEGR